MFRLCVRVRSWVTLLGLLVAWAALAAETGYASKELDLRAGPRGDTAITARIAKNTRFDIIGQEKSWAQISTGTQQGWVLFFYLIPAPASNAEPMNEVKNSFGLLTGKQGSGQVTAVLGVRGLDEEQLKSAKFDAEELKRLESLAVTKPAAQAYADEAQLLSRKLGFMPAPSVVTPQDAGGGRQ